MKTIRIMFESGAEMILGLIRRIKKNISSAGVLFMILWPPLLVYWNINAEQMLLVMVICLIVKEYFRRLDINLNNKKDDGMPVPDRRYTYDNGGMIDIRSEDIPEALQYLYNLEEYLYRKGKIEEYEHDESSM